MKALILKRYSGTDRERAGLKPGQKVFIPAGSGGIGTFAIRLAKHLGAKVARGTNFFMTFVFGLLSGKIIRRAKKRDIKYSFLFVHPDGRQLAEIGELLKAGYIRPVIDKVFPFDQAQEALAYLEAGRARGKVVVQMMKE